MANSGVYDKAKWHYDGNYPDELPQSQAFVHMGMFLAWLIDHDLYSEEFRDNFGKQIVALKARVITGAYLLEQADGVFADDMLGNEGNAFTRYYYGPARHSGHYLFDYEEVVGSDMPTLYHVGDTWENYERIAAVLDRRYQEWIEEGRPSPREAPTLPLPLPAPRQFWRRRYGVYLVLGKSSPLHAYDWAVWEDIARMLDPIIAATRGKVGVRSIQTYGATYRQVPFGRLSWDEKSHMRWTHGSPLSEGKADQWSFFATEVWAPHWRVCEREDCAPDVFMAVQAEDDPEGQPFDQELLIAVHEGMPRDVLEHDVPSAVGRISEVIHGVLTATTTAQWGQPTSGGAGFTDAIEDFMQWGLRQARRAHEQPTLSLLPGSWRHV